MNLQKKESRGRLSPAGDTRQISCPHCGGHRFFAESTQIWADLSAILASISRHNLLTDRYMGR